MNHMKRMLAMLLALVMIVGVLPMSVLAAEETVLDAAIFCSDVHGNPSTVSSIFQGIKSADSTFKPSTVSFVGDTQCAASSVTSAAQGVFSGVQCIYAFGNHDDEGNYGIADFTGLSYGDQNTNYYIYTISENSMGSSNPDTSGFTTTVSGLDKTKPLFIISHMPLHARRGDNKGAAAWYSAISAAAESMDIFFFWAHNHTGDNEKDQAAYYVAKDGTETISIQGGSTVTPNFTYANAGYIDPPNNAARMNVATAVRIYGNSVQLTVYNANGVLTGSYAVNETITREFAPAEEETATKKTFMSDDEMALVTATATNATITNVSGDISAMDALIDNYAAYSVSMEGYVEGTEISIYLALPEDMSATNVVLYRIDADGNYTQITDYEVVLDTTGFCNLVFAEEYDSLATYAYGTPIVQIPEGAVLTNLTVVNKGITKYFVTENSTEVLPLNITGLVVTATYSNGTETVNKVIPWNEFGKIADGYALTFDMKVLGDQDVVVTYQYGDDMLTGSFPIWIGSETVYADDVTVTVQKPCVTDVAYEDVSSDSTVAAGMSYLLTEGFIAYDISLSYVDDKGLDGGNATVKMPAPANANAVYYLNTKTGSLEKVEGATFENGYVTFTTDHFSIYVVGEISEEDEKTLTLGNTTTTPKTVYVLSSGNPSPNTSYLIVNGNSAGNYYALAKNNGSVAATEVTIKTDDKIGTYIELDDVADELWTVASGYTFKNGSYYLNYSGSKGNYSLSLSTSAKNWSYSSNQLTIVPSKTTYYLAYDSGWKMSSSSGNVYFYVPTEVEVTVDNSTKYEVSADNITHIYDSDDSTLESAALNYQLLANGATATFDGEVWEIAVVSDANGIIDKEKSTNEKLYFTDKVGEARVRVYYKRDANGDGDVNDDDDYKVWTTITVKTTAPYYSVNLHKADFVEATGVTADDFADGIYFVKDSTTGKYTKATAYEEGTTYYTIAKGDEIKENVPIKGVVAGQTYQVWAVVMAYTSANPDGEELGYLGDKLTWAVNNPAVATIDAKTGEITFTGKDGTVQVSVRYTGADGVVYEDIITLSVTKSLYIVPSDGTNDFPEYPEQGAIRFDKTAESLGNFSQTGIAKVELSMTGVPYGASTKTDVVIMVDMTASMSSDDVTAAEAAVKELIEALTYDEENDKYDSNIQIFVDVFYSASTDNAFSTEEYLNCVTVSNAEELSAAQAKIDFTQSSQGGGTRYNLAMKDVYETLNRDGHADKQFVVFVSDGVPTAYAPASFATDGTVSLGTTLTGSNSEDSSLADGWFDLTTGAVTSTFKTEYYSYLIKNADIPVYTVGCNLTALTEPAEVLAHMSSNYSADGKTATGETTYSFFCTTSGGITDEVLAIFAGIGQSIKEAATDVVVEDKIDKHYTVNFALPSGVTAEEAGMDAFYIQAVGYELDANNERKGNPTVYEKFLFNSDGTVTHTIGATVCDGCTHVTNDSNGVVTAIDGTYFDYESTDDGEFIHWYADKLDRTELALQYFVYLDKSAGYADVADQVAAGTYYTNEYATLTYTNHLGHRVQQEFPVPQLTWNGAQVTYVFYLVNENGQPVNRAGKVVPFAEAVYVTVPVTYDVTWNEVAGEEKMLAKNLLAFSNVPSVYTLYDPEAYYEIRVYQTEGVDNNAENYNYFIIEGSSSIANKETTKVFNTKAGTKYDDYGAYSATAGTYTSANSDKSYTATVTSGVDYANTTVAFAVVWKPELKEDTVVVDFGLDVIIDVYTNDGMASGVTGVGMTPPSDVKINNGTYSDALKFGQNSITDGDGVWTATVESLKTIRFHMDKMLLREPVKFFYEAGVNYYTYDAEGNATLVVTNMYSSVTVIPATTIYYEDEFVELKTFEKNEDGTYTETKGWDTDSVHASDTQAQDRPGASKISKDLDADNNYGYDEAYKSMGQFSMGTAAMTNVNVGKYATATFTFYGTGFDIISLTSATTGIITINVYKGNKAEGNPYVSETVDTYYGYKKVVADDGTVTWETTTSDDTNALYQVPVMKIGDGKTTAALPYAMYTVVITATYIPFLDHNKNDTGYNFYLDAIRIYNPAGDNEEANDAYVADGEAEPTYEELRDMIISANDFSVLEGTAEGIVFIDGIGNTANVTDYVSYGPNNELYLANEQAIAFALGAPANLEKIQLAIKSVGETGHVKVYSVDANGKTLVAVDMEISTATDMYYDITDLKGQTVIIESSGTAIISLTNIKFTYKEASATAENGDSNLSIMSLIRPAVTEEKETYLISVSAEMIERVLNVLNGKVEVEPERPFEPAPGKPSKPGSGNKPVAPKPSQPIKPSIPAKPIKPVRPVVPTMPVNPGLPALPGRPGPVVAVHIY